MRGHRHDEFRDPGAVVDPVPKSFEQAHGRDLRDGKRTGLQLDFAIYHPHGITRERAWRRTGRNAAVVVIDAAMAGAHEKIRVCHPSHRADDDFLCAGTLRPDGALGL